MTKVLFTWLDDFNNDAILEHPKAEQPGAIATTIQKRSFDKLVILSGFDEKKTSQFEKIFREKYAKCCKDIKF